MEGSMLMSGSWYEGPSSDQTVNEPHGRPILCMDVLGDKVVTGSSDHGLREYVLTASRARPSMASSQPVMKQKRQLYNKKYGHTEWVTTVAYAPDGKVLSGAMDSKLCLWDKSAVRCDDITGHKSSISKVMVDSNGVGISASYDASLLVWDLSSKECLTGLFKGHKDAVTTFDWYNSLVISAARDGSLAFWDINSGKALKKTVAHEGAVAKIKIFENDSENSIILTSGLNDGVVCAHDMRSNKLIS